MRGATQTNGAARPRGKRGTGAQNLTHVRVGAWWRLVDEAHAADPNRYRGPRQVAEIDRGDPLLPRVRWEPCADSRYNRGRKTISIGSLLKLYVPCDPPETKNAEAPKPVVSAAWPQMRVAIREEVRDALEAFVSALRPVLREEARAAINEAFAQGGGAQ